MPLESDATMSEAEHPAGLPRGLQEYVRSPGRTWTKTTQWLSARWYLRTCTQVGPWTRVIGRITVVNHGTMIVGERVQIYGHHARSIFTTFPGGRLIIGSNPAALTARYGALNPVAGPYLGSLDNSTETVRITAADGSTIKQFTYSDSAPWPEAADGDGYSLVLVNPSANPDHTQPANWRSSASALGQPGQAAKGTSYAAWKSAEGVTDDAADTDGDGLTAFAEYALGTSPSSPDWNHQPVAGTDTFAVAQIEGRYLTVKFRRRLGADDVSYDIESSSTLDTTPWSPGAGVLVSETNHGDGTATMVYRASQPITPGQPVFLRVRMRAR